MTTLDRSWLSGALRALSGALGHRSRRRFLVLRQDHRTGGMSLARRCWTRGGAEQVAATLWLLHLRSCKPHDLNRYTWSVYREG